MILLKHAATSCLVVELLDHSKSGLIFLFYFYKYEVEEIVYLYSLSAERAQQKIRRKSYFDSTSDLFFHICTKTVIILVQI